MKTLFLFLVVCIGLIAQPPPLPQILYVTTAPVGSCTVGQPLALQFVVSTLAGYSCSGTAVGGPGTWTPLPSAGGIGVTSVSFTGGLISVATPTTTPALTVAGTSGGIPYFSGATTWASSAALGANLPVIGGGAGTAPATVAAVNNAVGSTNGAGVFALRTALPNAIDLGTPSAGVLTNATGYPGDSSLVTVGTIGTGTWHASVIGTTYGGLGAALNAAAAHSTIISNGATPAVYGAKTIPDCPDSAGNHLNFTQSTDLFSCGNIGGSSTLNFQVGGSAIGTRGTLNFVSGTALTQTCADNPGASRVDCTPAVNSAVALFRSTDQAGTDLYCSSTNGSAAYTCSLTPTLTAYTTGMIVRLRADVASATTASLNIDGVGTKTIDLADCSSAVGTSIAIGTTLLWYNGTVFCLIGNPSGGGSPAFSAITTGTNTTATMTVGSGGLLTFSGTGVINADQINGGNLPTDGDLTQSNGSGQIVTSGISTANPYTNLHTGSTTYLSLGLGYCSTVTSTVTTDFNSSNTSDKVRILTAPAFWVATALEVENSTGLVSNSGQVTDVAASLGSSASSTTYGTSFPILVANVSPPTPAFQTFPGGNFSAASTVNGTQDVYLWLTVTNTNPLALSHLTAGAVKVRVCGGVLQ